MIVTLTNSHNFRCTFITSDDFNRLCGYESQFNKCYQNLGLNDHIFILRTHAGFFEIPEIVNTTRRGIQENGSSFIANHFAERFFTLNFQNSYGVASSANQCATQDYLANLFLWQNETLQMQVDYGTETYAIEVIATGDTTLEGQSVVLQSAKTGLEDGIMFTKLSSDIGPIWRFDVNHLPFFPLTLPRILFPNTTIIAPFKTTYTFAKSAENVTFHTRSSETGFSEFTNLNVKVNAIPNDFDMSGDKYMNSSNRSIGFVVGANTIEVTPNTTDIPKDLEFWIEIEGRKVWVIGG